jgi:hypothetical protein
MRARNRAPCAGIAVELSHGRAPADGTAVANRRSGMWRPMAMCLAVGWLVGCGAAGGQDGAREAEREQQPGDGDAAEAAAPFPDSGDPSWDGSPCNGSGTAVVVGDDVWFVPSECDPTYVDTGDPADKVQPTEATAVDI